MSKVIHISYFLNPYCFYFKFDDDLHNDGLKCLEDKISTYACDKIRHNDNKIGPIAVGDTVAAFVIPWGKWVRAVVRCKLDSVACYELWAVDHGKKFRTAYANVIKLPEDMANENVIGVHRGSLYGVAPAKLDFNLALCKSEIQPIDKWSEKAISQCMELLADETVMKTEFEIKAKHEKCYFGDVFIETGPARTRINIADALKTIDEAVDIEFESELVEIEAKFRTSHLKNTMPNRGDVINSSAVRKSQSSAPSHVRSDTQSSVVSTVVPSEIDNGATRMKTSMRVAAPSNAPSCVQSTVIPSEINGGATQMQKKNGLRIAPPSELSNAIKPANGPNRKLATNYTNGNRNQTRRQMPPMPAGHEPDIENFRKYNS